ncbi:MAG: PAS domain S-box protein [Humidesulfovibrio sp.]|nr:PAS domain S-box protein [Humidesulfovibrio sp.]
MKPRLRLNLTLRLALVVLVALVPAVLITVAQQHDLRASLRAESIQRLHRLSETLAGQGRENVSGARQLLAGLARLPQVRAMDKAALTPILRDVIRQSPLYTACTLYDTSGRVVATSWPTDVSGSVADKDWFRQTLRSLACTEGEAAESREVHRPLVLRGCPVLDVRGRLTGVLDLVSDYSWFGRVAGRLVLPAGTTAAILGSDGSVHTHFPDNDGKAVGDTPNIQQVLDRVRAGQDVAEETGPDGARLLCVYSVLTRQPGRELFVRVAVPEAQALAPAEESAGRSALGLAAAALLGLLGAYFSARNTIIGPAREILDATRRLGAGDLTHRINSQTSGELAEVARGVDSMAACLEASTQALRQAEQKVRFILENSVEGYFVSSLEGRFLEANPALLRLLGYESLEALQAGITDIGSQVCADPGARQEILLVLTRNGCVRGMELECFRRDGSLFWILLSVLALHDDMGRIIGAQGFATDITESKHAALELARANERFLHVLDNQADALFVADAETDVILYANRAAQERVGRGLVGGRCWAAMHDKTGPCPDCPRQLLMSGGDKSQSVCTREIYDPRTDTWSLVRTQALRWVDGRMVRLETATDITDIKQTQETLRVTSGYLQSILENAPMYLSIRDLDGRFVVASKRIRELGVITRDDLTGMTVPEVYSPEFAPAVQLEDQEILRTGLPLTKIANHVLVDGSQVTLLLSKFLLRDAQGRPVNVCTIGTDITERVRLEREVLAAKEAAENANRAKSDFLAKMSHEIRTPLNAILGFAELTRMAASQEEREGSLASLQQSGQTLLGLISDLLDLSRVEAGHLRLDAVSFDLAELLRDMLEHPQVEAKRRGLVLEARLNPEVPAVLVGDPGRLRQILANLVANALKFTHVGGVDLSVELAGPDAPAGGGRLPEAGEAVRLLFSVHDTGIGIPEDVQGLMFESFTQADSSTSRRYGGSGLGLAICRQLARGMGGEIWLTSMPGQGSNFYISLPFSLPPEAGVSAQAVAGGSGPGGTSSDGFNPGGSNPDGIGVAPAAAPARSLSVLLAEDTPANVIIAQSFLTRLGHRTRHAATGREALTLLAGERFDLVLMDVEMPGMDGLTATRLLRAGEAGELNRGVTVLAMTAHVLESFRKECSEAGMNGFLPKPVSFKALGETLAGLDLPPSASVASPVLADLDKAAEMLGGYEDLLAEVLEMFLADLPAKRRAVAELLAQDDMDALRRTAHTLKSTCASVGALAASNAARQVEQLAGKALAEAPSPRGGEALAEAVAALAEVLERSADALRAACHLRFG